jgi:hypothetical protein
MKNQRQSKISMAKNLVWSGVGVVLLAVTFGLYWSGAGNDLRFYPISAPVRQEDDTPRKLEALLKVEVQPVIRLYRFPTSAFSRISGACCKVTVMHCRPIRTGWFRTYGM